MSLIEARPRSSTIEALEVNLWHLQRSVDGIVAELPKLASRDDVNGLARRLDEAATKAELRALEARVASQSPGSTLDRALAFTTRLAVTVTAVAGGAAILVAIVRLLDR